mmetsp:Transcript_28953/g.92315  ORF Transcript_28953/g.92315 Transcript_28953/m.92315 type:complete len:203 (+) Transcript_28953:269-877(+)
MKSPQSVTTLKALPRLRSPYCSPKSAGALPKRLQCLRSCSCSPQSVARLNMLLRLQSQSCSRTPTSAPRRLCPSLSLLKLLRRLTELKMLPRLVLVSSSFSPSNSPSSSLRLLWMLLALVSGKWGLPTPARLDVAAGPTVWSRVDGAWNPWPSSSPSIGPLYSILESERRRGPAKPPLGFWPLHSNSRKVCFTTSLTGSMGA